MRKFSIVAFLLVPAIAWASTIAYSITLRASAAATADEDSASQTIKDAHDRYVCEFNATHVSGTNPTIDLRIEHSPTGAAGTWKTLCSSTQATTSTLFERVHVNSQTTHVMPVVRGNIDVGGTNPSYSGVSIKLLHD